MQVRERVADVDGDGGFLVVQTHGVAALQVLVQQTPQVAALHELEHDAEVGQRVPSDTDERDDARVVHRSRHLGLRQEVVDVLDVGATSWEQHLDRDRPTVENAGVHFSVPASTEEIPDLNFAARDPLGSDDVVVPQPGLSAHHSLGRC